MPFYDPLAQREPDAGPLVFLRRMQPLEDVEDPVLVVWLDPDSLVSDRYLPLSDGAPSRNVNAWGVPAILDGVANQVLEHLPELTGVALDSRQVLRSDFCLAVFDLDREILEDITENPAASSSDR